MNLIYARVVEVRPETSGREGKVSVWGVMKTVPLHLVPEAQPGDTVLLCDGLPIGKVNEEIEQSSVKGAIHVSGSTG